MSLGLALPIVAFVAAAHAGTRKWIYVPLALIGLASPTVAGVVAAVALAWIARHYAAAAQPLVAGAMCLGSLTAWGALTGVTFNGWPFFALLFLLGGILLTMLAVCGAPRSARSRQETAMEPEPTI